MLNAWKKHSTENEYVVSAYSIRICCLYVFEKAIPRGVRSPLWGAERGKVLEQNVSGIEWSGTERVAEVGNSLFRATQWEYQK